MPTISAALEDACGIKNSIYFIRKKEVSMFNLTELKHFVTFAECGTLTKAAQQLHISQPTLTRSMQNMEREFGVALFEREKNRITLNKTGLKAVEYATKLLVETENCVTSVQEYDRHLHTITVKSCAPAPLWSLIPKLSSRYPDNEISSRIDTIHNIINEVQQGKCDIGVIPFEYDIKRSDKWEVINDSGVTDRCFQEEKLYVCVPDEHALAGYKELTFSQINGYNCLLKDKIGFWNKLCHNKMPASRFLIQTDDFEFDELVKSSTLLCFTTNLAYYDTDILVKRKIIPILDREADVVYHIISKSKDIYKI